MCACLDGVAALRTSSGAYCFKCLGWDHAEVVVQEPSSCIECQALPLQCDKSETELVIKGVETATIKCPTPPPFITQAETKASPPKDDDITSVSVISTSHGNAAPTSVRWDFPQVLTIAAGHVGLPLAPLLISKPVIFGRGFTVCQTPPQAAFVSPALLDICDFSMRPSLLSCYLSLLDGRPRET